MSKRGYTPLDGLLPVGIGNDQRQDTTDVGGWKFSYVMDDVV